jgi:LysW-gamma-L-lysine/LysW-L-ornithine aminotransferase
MNLPGTASTQELEDQYTSGVYTKRPLVIVRGKGAHLWDADGNEYIDCVGGQGAANVGHGNEQVAKAIADQAQTLISLNEIFYNPQRAALEERLCKLAGFPRVYLCSSGTEAVEGALKFARLVTGRPGVVAAMRAFHGRTMGSLSATWEKNTANPSNPWSPALPTWPITT